MRKYNKLILIILLIMLSALESFSQGMSISPTKLYFSLNAGEEETKRIQVKNQGEASVSFNVNGGDWIRDSLGTKNYLDANTIPNSVMSWLSINPTFLEVKPGETRFLDVTLRRPAQDRDEMVRWGAVFVEPIEEQSDDAANASGIESKITITYRVGILIYQEPSSVTTKGMDFIDLKIEDVEDGRKKVVVVVDNTDNSILDIEMQFELLNLKTAEEIKLEPQTMSILPFARRYFEIDLPADLKSGKYSLVVVLDYGKDYDLEVGEIEFDH